MEEQEFNYNSGHQLGSGIWIELEADLFSVHNCEVRHTKPLCAGKQEQPKK